MELKEIIKRFKDLGWNPWDIEASAVNYEILDSEEITREELLFLQEAIEKGEFKKAVKELWAEEIDGCMDIDIPEEVYEALDRALEDYTCANLCVDYKAGVDDFWYDDVINDFLDKVGIDRGLLLIYSIVD